MNYDDPSQQPQQQFYMQRMPGQQQRMMNPMAQNQQQMPQQMRQPQQYVMHPHQQPQPQQVLVRMPHNQQQGMSEDSPNPYQQQQTQIRDIIQTFPTAMQNTINNETNPEKKKQLFQIALQQQQRQQQMYEQQMQQSGMPMRMPTMNISPQRLPMPQTAGGAGMVYPSGQQIVIQQPGTPAQIQRIPSQGSFAQSPNVQPQMYVANPQQMGQTRVAPMQPMPINQPQYLQHNQISQQPQIQQNVQQTPQQQMQQKQSIPLQQQKSIGQMEQPPSATGMMPMSVGQMKKIQNSQMPQSNNQLQSANSNEEYHQATSIESKNVSMVDQNQKQPRSVGTPLSQMGQQQQQNEAETTEYKSLFDRLRTYHGDIKRILDRLNIDYPGEMKLKSSLINVIQVMEGTRKAGVNCQLLRKLLSNVQTVLEQYNNISRHLIGAAKKLNALSANARESLSKESIFIDPWSSVRHLQIKLPNEIANLQNDMEAKNVEANGIEKEILEDGPPPAKRSLLTLMAESFSPAKKYKVNCLDGSELCLNSTLSVAINEATNSNEFSVDFHSDDDQIQQPVSSNASTVQARFTFLQKSNVGKFGIAARNPQLDLLLPIDYPKSGIQIIMKNRNTSAELLDNLMEQIDAGAVNMHSLAEILEAWRGCLAMERLMLLEIAQVPPDYVDEFKSVSKFRIFNTNNLWADLEAIKRVVEAGELNMEVIVNPKHLDRGIDVIQLETAAGAAIKCFKGACGINVPLSRFLPVKKTSDLLLLMSNLYDIENGYVTLSSLRSFPTTPLVKLGSSFDKVKEFLKRFQGIPDLLELDHLTVSGDVWFGRDVTLKGTVIIIANHGDRIDIPAGTILENKIVSGNLRILDH